MTRLFKIVLITTLMFAAMPWTTFAEESYREYKAPQTKNVYFEIIYNNKQIEIFALDDEKRVSKLYNLKDLTSKSDRVEVDGQILFDDDGLHLGDKTYPLDKIYDTKVNRENRDIVITFTTKSYASNRISTRRRGNIVVTNKKVTVNEEDFVRGMIFTLTGDIEVLGELNRDAITIFGDIYIGPDAVFRGDAVSIRGDVDSDDQATIYGDIYSGVKQRSKWNRSWAKRTRTDIDADFGYNRVDGLRLGLGLKYTSRGAHYPNVWSKASYAFESERWRFDLGLEQPIYRSSGVAIGAEYYRRLKTEDDWIVSERENNAFALFVTEDYRDYYEAEGGRIYLKAEPINNISVAIEYTEEETDWLRSYRNLWSLFGGDKLFDRNFHSVASPERANGINEIDSSTNTYISASIKFDNRKDRNIFSNSSWVASLSGEWSDPEYGSDFKYSRFIATGIRYQRINRHTTLILRAKTGWSENSLPMHKRFYIGGIGSLRGYEHKEFSGSKFWMTNLEYRFAFPHTDLALSVLWDAARVTSNDNFSEADEVKQSIGVAFYLGDDFRMSLSKRLDRSYDNNPIFYTRVVHAF